MHKQKKFSLWKEIIRVHLTTMTGAQKIELVFMSKEDEFIEIDGTIYKVWYRFKKRDDWVQSIVCSPHIEVDDESKTV